MLVKTQSATAEDASGESPFKKGATPLDGSHTFTLPSCITSFHLSRAWVGDTHSSSALSSLEEHNFAEVGTFQPSLGFKDFHQAARLHPLADGHPRR